MSIVCKLATTLFCTGTVILSKKNVEKVFLWYLGGRTDEREKNKKSHGVTHCTYSGAKLSKSVLRPQWRFCWKSLISGGRTRKIVGGVAKQLCKWRHSQSCLPCPQKFNFAKSSNQKLPLLSSFDIDERTLPSRYPSDYW